MSAKERPGEPLRAALEADVQVCLSCNACRSVCTMHLGTGRLLPLELVRMAAIGMREPLLRAPELWYCLQCNRCSATCPMSVKPAEMFRQLRHECVREGVVDDDTLDRHEGLLGRVQRLRLHLFASGARGAELEALASAWERSTPSLVEPSGATVDIGFPSDTSRRFHEDLAACLGFPVDLAFCMTCGACTTVCPVAHDGTVYDPVRLFRLANLGLDDELLRSPSIWLCLACGACTAACGQGVAGDQVLRGIQELSMRRGLAPPDMRERSWEIDRVVYPIFVTWVDELLERNRGSEG